MTDKKTFVLDTSVLADFPHALYAFDDNNVCIADVTLEELDALKIRGNDTGANARAAIRIMEALRQEGDLTKGIQLPGGGIFHIELNHRSAPLPPSWDESKADNRIIRVCVGLAQSKQQVILVSNDVSLRIKASALGVPAEEYRAGQIIPKLKEQYTGRCVLRAPDDLVNLFYQDKELSKEVLDTLVKEEILRENQFVLLQSDGDDKHSALGRVEEGRLVALHYANEKMHGVTPRNMGQRFMQEALMMPCERAPLVILKGAAGTAKTFFAVAAGLWQIKRYDQYSHVLAVRPNVKFDEEIGFLKGTEEEKIAPLMRPIVDNILALFPGDPQMPEKLEEYGIIVNQAMAFMRGRSITDTWIIVDEAQNMTPSQAFGIISRAGANTKIVLAGDPEQIDNPYLDSTNNGLVFAAEKMKDSPLCWQITLDDSECVRSPLAREAVRMMKQKGESIRS